MLRVALPLLASAVVVAFAACGTSAVGGDACRQVEEARCRQAPSCPQIPLGVPVHGGDDVAACIRFYDDACLHGLVTPNAPGATDIKACVDAIQAGDCGVVVHPENAPACAWLLPPAPAPTATTPADAATDAPTDG